MGHSEFDPGAKLEDRWDARPMVRLTAARELGALETFTLGHGLKSWWCDTTVSPMDRLARVPRHSGKPM